MGVFVIDVYLDGYDSEEEMNEGMSDWIYEQLNFSGSGVTITPGGDIEKELIRLKEENKQLRRGKPLGAIVGAQTIIEQSKEIEELKEQLKKVKEVADYANNQADMAHLRLIKGESENLYDDSYWQSVLDIIRDDLYQIKK